MILLVISVLVQKIVQKVISLFYKKNVKRKSFRTDRIPGLAKRNNIPIHTEWAA